MSPSPWPGDESYENVALLSPGPVLQFCFVDQFLRESVDKCYRNLKHIRFAKTYILRLIIKLCLQLRNIVYVIVRKFGKKSNFCLTIVHVICNTDIYI